MTLVTRTTLMTHARPNTSRALSPLDSNARAGARATDGAALTRESQRYVGSRSNESLSAADERCQGCDQPAHDVGVLAPCLVTFTTGGRERVAYCEECLHRARLAIAHPGEGYGAAALPTSIAAVERLVPRVALASPCGMSETELVAAYRAHAAPMVSETDTMPSPRLWSAR